MTDKSRSPRPSDRSDRLCVREAVAEDVEWIRSLNEAALPAVNSVSAAFFAAWIEDLEQDEEGLPFFAVAEEHVGGQQSHSAGRLGFVLALPPARAYESLNYRWFGERFDRFLYVDRIVVDGDRRGLGVGRFLYDAVVVETQRRGLERVCCEVNLKPRNEGSLRFHSRYGFLEVGRQPTEEGKKEVSLQVLEVTRQGE